nr:hypothetical protein [Microbacterium sp. NIBRBAC000506063]
MTTYSVTTIPVGEAIIPGPELYWMNDFDRWHPLTFQVQLIRGEGVLALVNTGPALDLEPMNAGWASFLGEKARMRRPEGWFVLDQLAALGVAPEQITHVILTPLQLYTVSNVLAFPNATICIAERGWVHFHTTHEHPHDNRATSIPDDILVPLVTTAWPRVRLLKDEDVIAPGLRTWWSGVTTAPPSCSRPRPPRASSPSRTATSTCATSPRTCLSGSTRTCTRSSPPTSGCGRQPTSSCRSMIRATSSASRTAWSPDAQPRLHRPWSMELIDGPDPEPPRTGPSSMSSPPASAAPTPTGTRARPDAESADRSWATRPWAVSANRSVPCPPAHSSPSIRCSAAGHAMRASTDSRRSAPSCESSAWIQIFRAASQTRSRFQPATSYLCGRRCQWSTAPSSNRSPSDSTPSCAALRATATGSS